MKMLIVESKAKSKTIQKYLGKNYLVRACMGHVQDLPSGNHKESNKAMWASNEGSLPNPPWDWTERSEKVVMSLKKEAKDVDEIFLATDPDREGEFIAWRLSEILGEIAPCKRIVFHEITKTAIEDAISNSSEVDIQLVDAAKVRRFMDRLVGFRSSKFARSWRLNSMGRVQTPTLGFVVERELERESFVPTPFFSVNTIAQGINFNAKFHAKDDVDAWRDQDDKFDSNRTNDEKLAKEAFDSLTNESSITITANKNSNYSRNPSPPFTTDALLQAAGGRWSNWTPKKTMRVASELYNSGHITYIRTDSTRTNSSSRDIIKNFINEKWGPEFVGTGVLGKKVSNAQDAHEAIRPTRPEVQSPEGLGKDESQLYGLIWSRFAGSQMTKSEYQRYSLTAEVDGFSKTLSGTYSWRTHAGWELAFEKLERNKPNTSEPSFDVNVGSKIDIEKSDDSPRFIQDETKPPRRFRQHTLVSEMKDRGIGRPSTYATTIDKLIIRKYVNDESGSLIPTEKGRICWLEVAPMYTQEEDGSNVAYLFSADFTAEMEERLDAIEVGERDAPSVWNGFTDHFRSLHAAALELKRQTPTTNQIMKFNQLTQKMSEDEISDYLGGREINQITGPEISDIIKQLLELGPPPATEKQCNYVMSLIDGIEGIDIDSALLLVEIQDLDSLTMDKASTLIGILKEKMSEQPRPISEPQLKLLIKKIEQLEISEEEACKLVGSNSFDELSGGKNGNASELIGILIEKTGGKRRGRRKGNRK
ncbi:MAG: DNA topoisomerase 1 [Thermoplasmata archaeon]|nr:DNA topoisomerase 1 [Thermoplasmata archaeon]